LLFFPSKCLRDSFRIFHRDKLALFFFLFPSVGAVLIEPRLIYRPEAIFSSPPPNPQIGKSSIFKASAAGTRCGIPRALAPTVLSYDGHQVCTLFFHAIVPELRNCRHYPPPMAEHPPQPHPHIRSTHLVHPTNESERPPNSPLVTTFLPYTNPAPPWESAQHASTRGCAIPMSILPAPVLSFQIMQEKKTFQS